MQEFRMPTDGLESTLDWLEEFNASNFRGSTTAEQGYTRRWYLGYINMFQSLPELDSTESFTS